MPQRAMRQYQDRDWDVVDYEMFEIPKFPYALRGPAPSRDGGPVAAVIGAAQSFGVLVRTPYVHMLARDTGYQFLNCSVGGASPGLFLRHSGAVEACNAANICIVQALSARSSDNSYFESRDGKNMLRPRDSSKAFLPGDTAYEAMFRKEPPIVSRLVVGELRANWTKEMMQLLHAIKVPKILLWFSKRAPDLPKEFASYRGAAGAFPQFVNREMIEEIKPFADHYVEVVSSRGVPNRLVNRFTGEPASILLGDRKEPRSTDSYYPSPEMHEDVHAALLPVVRDLIARIDERVRIVAR